MNTLLCFIGMSVSGETIIDAVIKENPIDTSVITPARMRVILEELKNVLDLDVVGDIVLTHCDTSVVSVIRGMLLRYGSTKPLHVCDALPTHIAFAFCGDSDLARIYPRLSSDARVCVYPNGQKTNTTESAMTLHRCAVGILIKY